MTACGQVIQRQWKAVAFVKNCITFVASKFLLSVYIFTAHFTESFSSDAIINIARRLYLPTLRIHLKWT